MPFVDSVNRSFYGKVLEFLRFTIIIRLLYWSLKYQKFFEELDVLIIIKVLDIRD